LGRPLLHRDGKRVAPTEEGERLLSYARRILSLAEEARDVVARPASDGVVRLGMSEDFAAYRLTEMLSGFVRSRPGLRLDVRCGLSVHLRQALERGELDLALFKRDLGETGGVASWPERLHWIASRRYPIDFRRDPLPLAVFEQGCLYRNRSTRSRRPVVPGTLPIRGPCREQGPPSPQLLLTAARPRTNAGRRNNGGPCPG
jgi:DNA-binding transcriptional LysR family regulator